MGKRQEQEAFSTMMSLIAEEQLNLNGKVELPTRLAEKYIQDPLPPEAMQEGAWWTALRKNRRFEWLRQLRVSHVDSLAGLIVLVPDPSVFTARQPRGGYSRMSRYLRDVPEQQDQIAFTFEELGAILGNPLPATARYRQWWANTDASPQGRSWSAAGWSLQSVYLSAKIVVFRRTGRDALSAITEYVRGLLEGAPVAARRDATELCQWIRLCRLVGWYFEGRVLYERAGPPPELLSEIQRVELDEDYSVCKRELNRHRPRAICDEGL